MDDERSDSALIHAHVAGDAEAFATLIGRHKDRLWGIAMRTMRNETEAADALQEALISAFRRAHQFRGGAAVTTWLHRIVVNACLDRIRRNQVRATQSLPDDADRWFLVNSDEEPEQAAEHAETCVLVDMALDQINPEQRAALVLVDMEGYSIAEAAAILGCAPGTVKSRCARGRAKLAPLLTDLRSPCA